jgi:hypothetical protein
VLLLLIWMKTMGYTVMVLSLNSALEADFLVWWQC